MLKKTAVAMLCMVFCTGSMASSHCPKTPKDQWLHVLDMQKKIVNDYGFAITRFLTDGHCYEIYGWGLNEAGDKFVKIEVYFNPINGDIVKKKTKG